jgi:hypothetical protein
MTIKRIFEYSLSHGEGGRERERKAILSGDGYVSQTMEM